MASQRSFSGWYPTKRPEPPWLPGTVVVAQHTFKSSDKHDLQFSEGDILHILKPSKDPNWYMARNECGESGVIPVNFVTLFKPKAMPNSYVFNVTSRPVGVPVVKEVTLQSSTMPWYHGNLTREDVEKLLTPKSDGLFLVREARSYPGDFTLSLCYSNEIEHYHIKHKNAKYTIDGDQYFESLNELIYHYQKSSQGICTRLHTAVYRRVERNKIPQLLNTFSRVGWLIPKEQVTLIQKVDTSDKIDDYEGSHKDLRVAIRSLKDSVMDLQEFLNEASILTRLSHKNIIHLIGVSLDQRNAHIITEFMEKGSLTVYLRMNGRAVIHVTHQANFARDVCAGMVYLESKEIIHKKLMAQNIVIRGDGSAAISDFQIAGCERNVSSTVRIPYRWTPPEALEYWIFSNKSDVWSYGVLLWEIYTFGSVPFPDVPMSDMVSVLKQGQRLRKPKGVSAEIYQIMDKCWKVDPTDRPDFRLLQKDLKYVLSF